MMGSGVVILLTIKSGNVGTACYLGSMLYGIGCSSMYPLIMSFAVEEGLTIEDGQIATILLVGVLSEGILTTLVGQLIDWFHPNILFYSLLVFSMGMWLVFRFAMR